MAERTIFIRRCNKEANDTLAKCLRQGYDLDSMDKDTYVVSKTIPDKKALKDTKVPKV